MATAMMTRNRQIGAAIIAHLRTELTFECVAGVLLVSLERVLWFDTESVMWAVESLIPADIMQEIQTLTAFTIYKQLVAKGFIPGQDLSVDSAGKLLLKEQARLAVSIEV
jgi:hypothetical protein